jgi:hypothetical protein
MRAAKTARFFVHWAGLIDLTTARMVMAAGVILLKKSVKSNSVFEFDRAL